MSLIDETDRQILQAIKDGLPLVERPFRSLAEGLRLDEGELLKRLERLRRDGVIRKFGGSIDQRKIGVTANALILLDALDEAAERVALEVAGMEEATHCYERERVEGRWPYNLYVVVHMYNREEVEAFASKLSKLKGVRGTLTLFSTKQFKRDASGYLDLSQPH